MKNSQLNAENAYHNGAQLEDELIEALQAADRGASESRYREQWCEPVEPLPAVEGSCNVRLLFVQLPRSGDWRPIVRVDTQKVGSHFFNFHRPFELGLSADHLVGCVLASGGKFTNYLQDRKPKGSYTRVDDVPCVRMHHASGRTYSLYCEWHGLWHAVGTFRETVAAPADDYKPRRYFGGEAHPDIKVL